MSKMIVLLFNIVIAKHIYRVYSVQKSIFSRTLVIAPVSGVRYLLCALHLNSVAMHLYHGYYSSEKLLFIFHLEAFPYTVNFTSTQRSISASRLASTELMLTISLKDLKCWRLSLSRFL